MTVAYRTCPLCEAGCGLEVAIDDGQVVRIRGDRDDVFSRGFLCPKGSALKHLHEDPDRVRTPLVRRDGALVPATWDEAFAEIDGRLRPIVERHGRDAVAVYLGNPNAHTLAGQLYITPLVKALGTGNVYSASTLDQRPKEVASGFMFGRHVAAVPDIDRTDYLLMLGANPWASNGSGATAPDWPGRVRALLARGGKLVVVDPRRTRTAEEATEHHFIRPGTDALFLAAMAAALFEEGRVRPGRLAPWVAGLEELREVVAPFTPEAVAPACGIPAATTRRLAAELAAAPTAAVYGRLGTTVQEFGTLAAWLVDVLNVLTGNLDRPGGAMFTCPAAGGPTTRGTPRTGAPIRIGRRHSRVRGLPESFGELPTVCLAEEIETPGDGQVRALVAIAGNPVLSSPNAARLDRALASLEFMVAVDFYVNETTRHADVVLPVPSALSKSHYDIGLLQAAVRNVANYSPAVLPLGDGELPEWEVFARLALAFRGAGADADPSVIDEELVRGVLQQATADPCSPVHGRDVDELLAQLAPRTGPERVLDAMLRTGPYGDAFGASDAPGTLSLDVLVAHPHGIDFGPLEPRLPDVLRTPSGMIELAPPAVVADVARLAEKLRAARPPGAGEALLVGRRDLRSNNSWMHNVQVLVKGKPRCTMHVHPDDAERFALVDGGQARVASRTGVVVVPVEVTDAVMPGVVSIPHGWGHDAPAARLGVARAHAGVNSNLVSDERVVDALTGTAVLNGIPVQVEPA